MSFFSHTGLLSLSTTKPTNDTPELVPDFTSNELLNVNQQMETNGEALITEHSPNGLAFVSNGLLNTTSATSAASTIDSPASCTRRVPQDSLDVPGTAESFTSNGLLSSAGKSTVDGEGTAVGESLDALNTPPSLFVSNGLLSGTGTLSASASLSETLVPTTSSSSGFRSMTRASTAPDEDVAPLPPSSIQIPRASIRATTFDGQTIYLRRKPKLISMNRNPASVYSSRAIGNLLDVPVHRLMDQLSSRTAESLLRCDVPSRQALSHDPEQIVAEDMLWVDRYRPKKFTDLLGNERVARDAMTWIKQWDWCVFGKKRGIKRNRDEDENVDQDEFRRPREKVLLLSGPPGLGKTTLAHVLARQAGYEVMEINASDARSGSIVDDRIKPALESGSAIGSTKPVLLVIDEIDGATGAGDNANTFIHKLVQLIQVKPQNKHYTSRGKDKQRKRPILRPIICICNDHNASSLAKLRPHAYQIRFNRPADVHIVKRLKEICLIEDMKADSRALSTLVSVAKGDLRGCLNTLQFIKTRKEDVTESIIRKATSGMKEEDATAHSVLHNLFTPLSKKRIKELGLSDEEEARYVGRLSREIDSTGRESTIATGCFGHYTTLRRHDANLSRQEKAMDWLTTFDLFSSAMYSDGEFALHQYLPYTLVPFYPLFSERGGERVERNQADWEHMLLTKSNEEIFKSFSRCLQNATIRYGGDFRHLVSTPILQTEFAPYINRIISPPLRPVNSQVVRPHEKALMRRLVDIMSSLELRFVQEKADDGQLTYRLDPPIDVFVTYDGKRAADITVSRYAVRQLVSAEIDARLFARDTEYVEKGKRGKHSDFFGKSSSKGENLENEDGGDAASNANKRTKVLDTRDIADKPPTDFFGRPLSVATSAMTKTAARKNVDKKYRVQYRFLEGNSAAVRRPVKVSMFL
ncbi:hypothetical protein CPC08DRAFT_660610 [Agrocybe pediades]|nr:hypothetical protein CPC08DRAFT_660610 [Agrocybe pediades]